MNKTLSGIIIAAVLGMSLGIIMGIRSGLLIGIIMWLGLTILLSSLWIIYNILMEK